MKILVLGAGLEGTCSAWYLCQAGHDVTVIERQPGAGLETSFANGGQISVSHAEPWANPHVLPTVLKWLGKEDAPLLFRLRYDPALFLWGLRFLRECLPARTRRNIGAIVSLARYSRSRLQALRGFFADRGDPLDYDCLTRGILHLYTDPHEFARAEQAAAIMRDFGLDRHGVSVAECVQIEPALAAVQAQLVGGDYTASDESGDAHQFTRQLAARAAAAGVTFRYQTEAIALHQAGGRMQGVEIRALDVAGQPDGTASTLLQADAYVLCLASESPRLARPLGLGLPIYPAKGYSATVPLAADSIAPTVSLTDDGHKIVFSRLGQRLRIAGTAEFNGFNRELNPVRCQALMTRARQLFPQLNPAGEPEFWCGLRPATPSNVPLLGKSRYPDLWLNCGHGTLGWTMACGSAAALADCIGGRQPDVAFPFLSG